MTGFFEAARLRAGTMWRERKERIEAKRAEKALHQHHAAGQLHGHATRFFLLHLPIFGTLCAAGVEIWWAILFCIMATGTIDANMDYAAGSTAATAFTWDFAFAGHMPVLIGLLAAVIPIIIFGMVWLPMQFAMRGFGRWRRGTLIAVGLFCNGIAIVSGTVVQNENRQGHVRDALVTEQRGDAARAALVARRDAIQSRWATLTASSNTTLQAQAARAGVAGWDAYIATARSQLAAGTISQQRFDLIERARGSAVAAEAYQHQMDEMTGQIAAAEPAAATAAHVEDTTGGALDGFAAQVAVWRPVFVSVAGTVIGILGAWWSLAILEGQNPKDILRSGWADEAHRIEDKRNEPKQEPQPMVPPRQRRKVYNAETGEEEGWVEGHYRKTGKKKRRADGTVAEETVFTPPTLPDEQGVVGVGTGQHGDHEPVSAAEGTAPTEQVEDAAGSADSVEAGNDHMQQEQHEASSEDVGDEWLEPVAGQDDGTATDAGEDKQDSVNEAPDEQEQQPEQDAQGDAAALAGSGDDGAEADDGADEAERDGEAAYDVQDDPPVIPRALLPAAAE